MSPSCVIPPWSVCGLASVLLPLAACGSDLLDASGFYTIVAKTVDNGCQLADWPTGPLAGSLTITQDGIGISARFKGAVGLYLERVGASQLFTGGISTDTLLSFAGPGSCIACACPQDLWIAVGAELRGDVIDGDIHYNARLYDSACDKRSDCTSFQTFLGDRVGPVQP